MEATARNTGSCSWNNADRCVMCLRLADAPDLLDVAMDRTFIHVDGKFESIKDSKLKKRHFVHMLVPNDLDLIPVEDVGDYFRDGEMVDCSLIVRSSRDDRDHVALAWDDALEVSYNLGRHLNCLHSEPRFDGLKPGESKTVTGKISFLSGTRKAIYGPFAGDFPSLGYGKRKRPAPQNAAEYTERLRE